MTHSWLQTHFSSFVYPHVTKVQLSEASKAFPSPYFTSAEMTAIKAAWHSARVAARSRRIILAGRDVWVFEVLARRSGINTLFLPDLSRNTVENPKWASVIHKDDFLFDTGFSGTIPTRLRLHRGAWKLLSTDSRPQSILPNLLNNRDLALKIERTPKYWLSARYFLYSKMQSQALSDPSEFANAALLTQQLWLDSSPRQSSRPGLLKRNTHFEMPQAVSYAN